MYSCYDFALCKLNSLVCDTWEFCEIKNLKKAFIKWESENYYAWNHHQRYQVSITQAKIEYIKDWDTLDPLSIKVYSQKRSDEKFIIKKKWELEILNLSWKRPPTSSMCNNSPAGCLPKKILTDIDDDDDENEAQDIPRLSSLMIPCFCSQSRD